MYEFYFYDFFHFLFLQAEVNPFERPLRCYPAIDSSHAVRSLLFLSHSHSIFPAKLAFVSRSDKYSRKQSPRQTDRRNNGSIGARIELRCFEVSPTYEPLFEFSALSLTRRDTYATRGGANETEKGK